MKKCHLSEDQCSWFGFVGLVVIVIVVVFVVVGACAALRHEGGEHIDVEGLAKHLCVSGCVVTGKHVVAGGVHVRATATNR